MGDRIHLLFSTVELHYVNAMGFLIQNKNYCEIFVWQFLACFFSIKSTYQEYLFFPFKPQIISAVVTSFIKNELSFYFIS